MKTFRAILKNGKGLEFEATNYADAESKLTNINVIKNIVSLAVIETEETPQLQTLMDEWNNFTNATFYTESKGDAPSGIAEKLIEETNELLAASELLRVDPIDDNHFRNLQFELADCFGLLLDFASKLKMTANDLIKITDAKLQINLGRDWTRQANGTFKHN